MTERAKLHFTARKRSFWRALVAAQIALLVAGLALPAATAFAAPSPAGATIASDKADYTPGETVTLTGTGWSAGEAVDIVVNDTIGQTWKHTTTVTAGAGGEVVDVFDLPGYFISDYDVKATGPISGTATTTFTDLSIGTYDQCSNDDGDGYDGDPGDCHWINGNLNGSNSTYPEGDATVQRLWLKDFAPGSAHSVTFEYGTTKGGKHAYDFLTTWSYSENWINVADRCEDIAGCTTAAEDTEGIPQDPAVPAAIEVPGQLLTMRGGTITNVTTPTIVSGDYGGDSETSITVSFTVGASGSMCSTKGQTTTCDMALWFGAHIALTGQWNDFDGTSGAGTVPGSPYHVSLDKVDGASAGERDNQMQASAVVANGTIVIVKDAVPNDAQNFSFNLTNGTTVDESFNLDDDANATLPNSQSFIVPPGAYTAVEQNIPNGWSLTNLVCVDPSHNTSVNLATATATINLASGETVTCTYTDSKLGSITIIKDAVPNDAQNFGYTTTGTGLSSFSLDDDADATLSNTKVFDNLAPGSYSVTETLPVAGWSLTNLGCTTSGTGTSATPSVVTGLSSITLGVGGDVTCTYTNIKLGSITIIKNADPDSGRDFAYTTSGTGLSSFSLDDDADPTLSNTKTFDNLAPGAYSVTETLPVSGWSLTNLVCTPTGSGTSATPTLATGLASITLGAGGSVTCTYTNTKDATVTIVKDAVPDDAQDFAFTTTGTGPAGFTGGFSLDDDADATLPNSVTFTFPAAQQGAKTIVEGATAGWSLTNLVCTGDGDSSVSTATRTATLDVDPGEAITCTYTNTHDATVTIVKNAVPDNGQDFGYTTTGTGLSAFTLDDDGAGGSATPNSTTFTIPAAQFGGKTITETAVSGWSLTNLVCTGDSASSTDTATRTATLDVSAGEAITCTYTNTKDATVTIVKDALPDDAQDFGYTTTGSGLSAFTLDDDGAGGSATPNQTTFTIPAAQFGQKSVTESATSGWTLTDLTCSGASITYSNNNTAGIAQTATFTVGAGDAVTCTYTNTEDAKITIVKDADPADGTNFDYSGDLGAFQLDEGGAADAVNTSETFTIPGNELGTKGVTEAAKAAWTNTDITCVGSSSFTPDLATRSVNVLVEAGDDITCTFTNVKDATVTIVKDAVPNDAQDFAFTTTGTGAAGFTGGFSLDDDANATLPNTRTFTFPAAQLGAKTVVEGATSGWTLTNLSCSGDDNSSTSTVTRTATLDVDAGEAITCTYTNTKNPTIIVRKVTTGIAGGPFTFTTTGGNGLTTPFNLTTAAPGTPVQQSFAISAAGVGGDYSVTESALAPGFAFTDAACEVTVAGVAGTTTGSTPATRSVSITNLTAGTTVTCTFVNSGIGTTRTQGFWSTHLSLVQLVWNPAGGTIGTITHNGMTDAERTICDLAPIGVYDPAVDVGPLTVAQVMGGFWSNVSKTTTGAKRSSLDHARMLLLQQLLAAILNNQLFGSTPSGITIDQAKAAYCGTNINAIKAAATAMAAFNEGGDTGLFTPGASADPKAAKAIANLVYWNVLP